MAPKKRGRSSTPPVASGSSPRKKQRKTEEEEEEDKLKKEQKTAEAKLKKEQKAAEAKLKQEKKEAKKAFQDSLTPWTPIYNFTFPAEMKTLNKGQAMERYKLTSTEMATLPYQKVIDNKNNTIRTTHLFSVTAVEELARRKHGDIPETADAEDRRKQQAAANDYDEGLVKCLDYFLPDYEQSPSSAYTSPPKTTALPGDFAFRPGRRVTELEAMNLFLLNRHELQGLERQPRDPDMPVNMHHFGETLDYEGVQQRAMDVHGGFEAHNTLITRKAKEYTSDPHSFWNWPKYPPYLHHALALAPNVIRHRHEDLRGKALVEVWWPPLDFEDEDFVARVVCAPGQCRGPNPNVPFECVPGYDPGAKYPWMV